MVKLARCATVDRDGVELVDAVCSVRVIVVVVVVGKVDDAGAVRADGYPLDLVAACEELIAEPTVFDRVG